MLWSLPPFPLMLTPGRTPGRRFSEWIPVRSAFSNVAGLAAGRLPLERARHVRARHNPASVAGAAARENEHDLPQSTGAEEVRDLVSGYW